jgi:hypothetical protein
LRLAVLNLIHHALADVPSVAVAACAARVVVGLMAAAGVVAGRRCVAMRQACAYACVFASFFLGRALFHYCPAVLVLAMHPRRQCQLVSVFQDVLVQLGAGQQGQS